MDYLKIVLDGCIDVHTRSNYTDYIVGKSKEAKKLKISKSIFFDGLLTVVSMFESKISKDVNKRKHELAYMISEAKVYEINYGEGNLPYPDLTYKENCDKDYHDLSKELNDMTKTDRSVHLGTITNNRFHGELYYNEIVAIKKSIESVKGFYLIKTKVNDFKDSIDFIDDDDDFDKVIQDILKEFNYHTPIEGTLKLYSKFRKLFSNKADELTLKYSNSIEELKLKIESLPEPEPEIIPIFHNGGLDLFKRYIGKCNPLDLKDLSFIIHQLISDSKMAHFSQKDILKYLFDSELINKELYDNFYSKGQLVAYGKCNAKFRIARYEP